MDQADLANHTAPIERRGFTLLELLIVTAIIIILAGLLSPMLAKARDRVRAIHCASNLRQLGFGVELYTDDFGGRIAGLSGMFPTWGDTNTVQAWTWILLPYIKQPRVYLDPGRPTWMPELPIQYYFNLLPAYVYGGGPSNGPAYTVDLRAVAQPSAFVLMGEDLMLSPPQEIDPTNEKRDKSGFSGLEATFPPYHLSTANVLFGDGHVAAFAAWNGAEMTYWYGVMTNWQETAP